jgi:hypothetical protein
MLLNSAVNAQDYNVESEGLPSQPMPVLHDPFITKIPVSYPRKPGPRSNIIVIENRKWVVEAEEITGRVLERAKQPVQIIEGLLPWCKWYFQKKFPSYNPC